MKQKRRTVAVVAREVGVSPTTLRNWERRGLISPSRDWRGGRVYSEQDLERLRHLAGVARND
jgi:MerR family transcriptional regulator, heat shock protein HspR